MTEGEGPHGVAERLSINHSTERSRSRKIGTLCQKKYFETGLKKYEGFSTFVDRCHSISWTSRRRARGRSQSAHGAASNLVRAGGRDGCRVGHLRHLSNTMVVHCGESRSASCADGVDLQVRCMTWIEHPRKTLIM
jgi:hypothetical protein